MRPIMLLTCLIITSCNDIPVEEEAPGGLPADHLPPVTVTVTDLGTLGGIASGANAINDDGLIVGSGAVPCPGCSGYTSSAHAFAWDAGVMTDLGTLGGRSSVAHAINAFGDAAGSASRADNTTHATLWRNGQTIDLGTLGGGSVAYGINDAGTVVGSADLPPGGYVRFVGFKWNGSQMASLGVLSGGDWSVAQDINNNGVIVGQASTSVGAIRAVRWASGRIAQLGTLAGTQTAFSSAYAINDKGTIVGVSDTASGIAHAFVWQAGRMTDLGVLPGSPSSASSGAYGIDEAGRIVGTSTAVGGLVHAVMWQNGTIVDLGTLPTGNVSRAAGINVHGEVAGTSNVKRGGSSRHDNHAARWTVTP